MNTTQNDSKMHLASTPSVGHQGTRAPVATASPCRRWRRLTLIAGIVVGIFLIGWFARSGWQSSQGNVFTAGPSETAHDEEEPSDHDAHDHAGEEQDEHDDHALDGHEGHDHEADAVRLSPQARKNIALELVTISPQDFQRTISIPAVLVDRPGRSEIAVSAPMTGIIDRVYPLQGEAVAPGVPLFDLRLTHEDLVEKQGELLRAVEELDVVKREVARLDEVTRSGAVAGKRLLERQYEQQKLEAVVRAQRQALVLHGLAEEQVDRIIKDRRLLQSVTIRAPKILECESCGQHKEFLQVAKLSVAPGEHVAAGGRLCTLSDHCQLHVEGKAFQRDADVLTEAANQNVAVTAVVEGNGSGKHEVAGLKILYVENQVDLDSRALKFYLLLPNQIVRDERSAEGRHYIGWRYRPGQRVDVLVPVEQWKNRVVLPVDAVVQDGVDWFVYQDLGDRFERRPVHVDHRDQLRIVVENDGTLRAGDVVAGKGAYQIHLAWKNRSGGVDPHAGHSH